MEKVNKNHLISARIKTQNSTTETNLMRFFKKVTFFQYFPFFLVQHNLFIIVFRILFPNTLTFVMILTGFLNVTLSCFLEMYK